MAVYRDKIRFESSGYCDIREITGEVSGIVKKSGLNQGICNVSIAGSTAAISTMEYEPGLLKDIPAFFEKIIPSDKSYEHDKTWGDGNGFSHIRSFLLKTSLSLSFDNACLDLGPWQQIVFIDFDNKSRNRELIVQIYGE